MGLETTIICGPNFGPKPLPDGMILDRLDRTGRDRKVSKNSHDYTGWYLSVRARAYFKTDPLNQSANQVALSAGGPLAKEQIQNTLLPFCYPTADNGAVRGGISGASKSRKAQ